jgi:hypothetical protein
MMTVKELIAELEDYDNRAIVTVVAIDCGAVVQKSDVTEVRRNPKDHDEVFLISEIEDI